MNAELPTIVVLDDYERLLRRLADWAEIDHLAEVRQYHEPLRGDMLHAALLHADGVVLMRDRTPLHAQTIARLPRLKLVVFTGGRNTALDAAARQATAVSLEELLSKSKVVSLHLVPSAAKRHLLNAHSLAGMRPDSLLVNTSRSALVDTAALAQALAAGRPAMAALGVFDDGPLPPEHPLRHLPNAVLTPHLGFVAQPVFEQFAAGVVECLTAWLHGAPLPRLLHN